jgi:predicted kinase
MNIGLPGSGKSTLFRKLALPENEYALVATDWIRARLFGVSFDAQVEPQVWKIAEEMVKGHFRLGNSVIFDATNLRRADRRDWLHVAQQYGHEVLGIHFDVPLPLIKERNMQREAQWVVPWDVICRMHKSRMRPEVTEGFTRLITLQGAGDTEVNAVKEAILTLQSNV